MKLLISAAMIVGIFSLGSGNLSAQAPDQREPQQLASLYRQIEQLVRRYYPEATISLAYDKKRGAETIHFQYNTYPILMRYRDKEGKWEEPQMVQGPYVGGIWCDMALEKGRYAGTVRGAEDGVTEPGPDFYSHLVAPYSKKLDRNLAVQLRFPGGTPPEFMREFSKLVKSFDNYIGKPPGE
jgi:hypothetical protein